MKKIVCAKCGNSNILVSPEDMFICDYCGAILIDLPNIDSDGRKPEETETDVGDR